MINIVGSVRAVYACYATAFLKHITRNHIAEELSGSFVYDAFPRRVSEDNSLRSSAEHGMRVSWLCPFIVGKSAEAVIRLLPKVKKFSLGTGGLYPAGAPAIRTQTLRLCTLTTTISRTCTQRPFARRHTHVREQLPNSGYTRLVHSCVSHRTLQDSTSFRCTR